MITSIGLIELNSIARGIEAADAMLKAGGVKLLFAKPVCPGKFITLIHGDIGAVQASMETGVATGANHVINHLTIPRIHPSLLHAVNAAAEIDRVDALGVVEYFDIAAAIVGADSAAKTGNVKLIELRLGMGVGGKSYFTMCGEISDIKSAVKAALVDSEQRGAVIGSCVIPSPDEELFRQLI
jgi:microcompartment protein CcmL/EutN